jgi:glycosyltransferase involved in cell wall biosynthesis
MPLGVDVNYFNPRILNYPVSSDFKFLSIFEWGERKAQEVLLKAFNDTFRADEPVVLLCKANCTDPSVDVRGVIQGLNLSAQGGRIEFILNKYVPYYQLGALYRSADCFVLPTRGEGWGMPVLEAMACGLPAICTFWSAPTAFMSERNSYPLNVKRLIDAVAKCPYYTGFQWADPDEEHLRFLLRHVFEHQDEARAIGAHAAADVAAHWTVTHAAARIKQRLGEIEQERGLPNVTITTATPSRSTIAIDVSRTIGEQITGVGRYTLNIVQGLAEYPTDDAEFLLLPGFGGFVHPEYGKRYRCVAPATPNMRVYDGPLPAYASPDHLVPGVDLLHCTGNMVAPVGDTPCLMTIFDVSFLTHPEFHTWENINLCKHNFEQAVRRGAWFTAISQHSKNDFLRHYQVPPERVIVVPCTYDHHRYTPCSAAAIQRARQAYGLPDRYLLLLASLEPRKNAVTALRAVAARDIGVPLVIAGAKGWMNDALQCDIARAGTRVQNIGYVAEDDLPAVYSGAHGLVFPTLYEGFGLPVLEAMACGTPVITTRVASLPEVAGTAALYVDDPLDVDSLADAMQRLVQDTQLHARLHADGLTQAQRFQRQPIIARLLQAYRTVMEG